MGDYMVLQYLFFITTLGFITIFDRMAKKRMGIRSQGFLNLRLPKFISLAIVSFTAIIALYSLKNNLMTASLANYLAIPYFAAIAYFLTAFFRELKNV